MWRLCRPREVPIPYGSNCSRSRLPRSNLQRASTMLLSSTSWTAEMRSDSCCDPCCLTAACLKLNSWGQQQPWNAS